MAKFDILKEPQFYYPIIIGYLSFISWQVWIGNEARVEAVAHQEDIIRRLDTLESRVDSYLFKNISNMKRDEDFSLPLIPLLSTERRKEFRLRIVGD